MTTMTTIRVSADLRDRINALAADHGRTAGSMIETLLEEHLRREQVELAIRRMRSMTPQERDDYLGEIDDVQREVWGDLPRRDA